MAMILFAFVTAPVLSIPVSDDVVEIVIADESPPTVTLETNEVMNEIILLKQVREVPPDGLLTMVGVVDRQDGTETLSNMSAKQGRQQRVFYDIYASVKSHLRLAAFQDDAKVRPRGKVPLLE